MFVIRGFSEYKGQFTELTINSTFWVCVTLLQKRNYTFMLNLVL